MEGFEGVLEFSPENVNVFWEDVQKEANFYGAGLCLGGTISILFSNDFSI